MHSQLHEFTTLTSTENQIIRMTIDIQTVTPSIISPKTRLDMADIKAAVQHINGLSKDIYRYIYLRNLQSSNPTFFYKLLLNYTEELLPYLYTPTVGEACQCYHQLPIKTVGLYITATDRGNILNKLKSLSNQHTIEVVVVTDGERILGLGDLGAGGMGISEGKSLLYTAAAGIAPEAILPVCIDVGTNNPELLNDPAYAGLKQERIHGEEYDQLVEEFIGALKAWRPHFLLQFEDFANHTAFVLLEKYRHELCCFNDDIQGTACIALAGILSALRAQGKQQGGGEPSPSLADQTILFYGAGEAGAGIGELIAFALERRHGLTRQQGRQRCFFMDSKGLVTKSRLASLQTHKVPFAHDVPNCPTLLDAIKTVKPTVLIGVSTIPSSFNPQVLHEMSKLNTRPIIFPLSNPTSKSECTFEQAYNGTNGSVLFASGSPFPPLTDSETGITHYPAQSNNAYIFPAVGHAAVLTKAREINDDVFLVAAETLAKLSSEKELQIGRLFPRFSGICDVSAKIMAAVAEFMCATGLGEVPRDFISVSTAAAGRLEDWEAYSKKHMYGQSQKGGGGGGDARL